MSSLTRDEVRRIADLAHLALSEDELARFTPQLSAMLAMAASLAQLDTTGIEPTTQALALPTERDDQAQTSLDRPSALAAAPDTALEAGLFKVPRVL
ncbi:MAG: Asp-tRNA(Asn)/Glu-tRNA(Gln) amidotransferase subunit GatC [Acidobacteria bacterium]|nr:Asp-tRNA(Asn)/Glu-tRNA(Gln) amidotransferase subunit GatC [Acidobacteriota bacterium]